MRTRHLLTATLASAALLPAALVGTAGPAAAADWNGQSASGTVCANDARTIDTARLSSPSNATISLRYSPGCRTAWAHISGATAPRPSDSAGGSAQIRRSDGRTYRCNGGSNGGCSTAMVNDAGFTSYAYGEDDNGNSIPRGRTSSY